MALQQPSSMLFGFTPSAPANAGTQALNASTNYIAFAFKAQSTSALSAARVRCITKNGTGGTLHCQVWGDLNGSPDSTNVIDTLTGGTPSGSNTWVNSTGGSVALTQGTTYWVVFWVSDGAIATNNVTLGYLAPGSLPAQSAGASATSTNTGTSWSVRQGSGGIRFDFANGTYLGAPVQLTSSSSGSTQIFGHSPGASNQMGIRFTTPANAKMIVAGICGFLPTVTGTPTVGIFWNLLDASHSLIASTDTIPAGVIKNQANNWYSGNFSSGYGNQTLQPSTTYSITLTSPVSADTSSNAYPQRQYQWDSDSNSTPLIPYGAVMDFYDGTSWTQTANIILPMGLTLVTGGEFAANTGQQYVLGC